MFKIGDIVRLKHGEKSLKVTHVQSPIGGSSSSQWITAAYINTLKNVWGPSTKTGHASRFVLIEEAEEEGMSNTSNDAMLYQWIDNGDVKFGYKMAVNREGFWVMDPKGGGDAVLRRSHDVEEVVPYTVKARKLTGASQNATQHFTVDDPDILEPRDLILTTGGSLMFIVEVDTNQKTNMKIKPGFMKVQTIPTDPPVVSK